MMEMGKAASLIGNPGSGKSNLFLAAFHQFTHIGWTQDKRPPEWGLWMSSVLSGKPLPPTIKQNDYEMRFNDVFYKGSRIKTGWGGLTLRIRDIRGDDYARSTDVFKESVRGASAVLITIDPSKAQDLGPAIGDQVYPLVNAIDYMLENEKKIKYMGLVFTKRALHNHSIHKIRYFVTKQLGPLVNDVRRKGINLSMLEVESRGTMNELEPWGLEPLFYDMLSSICKVEGQTIDVFYDPNADWEKTGPRAKKREKYRKWQGKKQ